MKLSIVIVSYNVCSYLEKCLDSVEKALAGIDSEVFVVDNASTDNTMAVLPERYPWVRFIANDENLGFARAHNIAIILFSFLRSTAVDDLAHFQDTVNEHLV